MQHKKLNLLIPVSSIALNISLHGLRPPYFPLIRPLTLSEHDGRSDNTLTLDGRSDNNTMDALITEFLVVRVCFLCRNM